MYNQQLLPKSFYHPPKKFDIDNICGPPRIFLKKPTQWLIKKSIIGQHWFSPFLNRT